MLPTGYPLGSSKYCSQFGQGIWPARAKIHTNKYIYELRALLCRLGVACGIKKI